MNGICLRSLVKLNTSMNESYLKVKWNIAGIFDDLPSIVKQLENQKNNLPENHKKERKKLTNWINQINAINKEIQNIKGNKIPLLEKNIKCTFKDTDLVVISFIQPSFKKLFEELEIYYQNIGIKHNFEPYLYLDQAAKVLAFIGDAAIDLALVQVLWQPNISSVGDLSVQRSEIAANKNLAKACDKWKLYDSRIPKVPNNSKTKKETINHTKGTIIEALFGVIYMESGLEKIISSVVALK